MDFLNIGSGEFVFLILLAILLVGPKRAVEWIQHASRFAARLQQEWRAVQRDVMREVRALQQETLSAVQPALQEVAREGQALQQEAASTLQPLLQEAAQELQSAQKALTPETTTSATASDSPLPALSAPTNHPAG